MLKHKLFRPDAWSLPDLSKKEDLPLEVNCNQSVEPERSYTPDEGIVIKNMTTPLAKRKKLDSAESKKKNHCELLPDPKTPEPSTSKNCNDEYKSESDVSCFSDNESETIHTKYFPSNHKLPYSYEEDEMILKFVLKEQNIFRASSVSLWKYLEAKKVKPKRTYQSLKNRFMRNIKPHLFTSFKHLIDSKDVVEKILIKFPELKKERKNQKFLSLFGELKIEEKIFEEVPVLISTLNNCEVKTTKKEEMPLTAFSESKSENFIQSSLDSSKAPEIERIVRLHKNVIQVSIHYPKPEVPFPTVLRLSERFEKLKENNKLFPCPTCGRSFRPVSNSSSGSECSDENDIPNSVPTETDQNNGSVSKKNSSQKMSLSSRYSRKSSACQNSLRSLEKSDKLDGDPEEFNSLPDEVTEKEEIEDIIEVVETPIAELKVEKEDRTAENDIDFIYENTVERFQELIDADEEKTSQEKCSNKNSDSFGFDDNSNRNLDSFFLETPLELEIPTLTPQAEVNTTRRQSQRVTRSSVLASNMMKMMTEKTRNKRKCEK